MSRDSSTHRGAAARCPCGCQPARRRPFARARTAAGKARSTQNALETLVRYRGAERAELSRGLGTLKRRPTEARDLPAAANPERQTLIGPLDRRPQPNEPEKGLQNNGLGCAPPRAPLASQPVSCRMISA